jgi:hypothetical protein
MSMREAIGASAVPIYQELAVNLQEVVHSVRTGNADVAKRQ